MNYSKKPEVSKQTVYETYIKLTGIIMLAFAMFFIVINMTQGVNLFDAIDQSIAAYFDIIKSLAEQEAFAELALFSEDQIKILEEMMYDIKNYIPVIITILSMFIAFIFQWITYKIGNVIHNRNYRFPPFRELNFPKIILWIYLLMIIIMFFSNNQAGTVFHGIINVYSFLSFLMIIQGFSYIFHFAYVKKIHVVIPIILVFVFLFINILMVFVQIIGIIDIGFGLKKRVEKKAKKLK